MKYSLLIFFALLTVGVTGQEQTRLYGQAPDFAGEDIKLYRYTNRITNEEEQIGVIGMDADGSFETTLSLKETSYIFMRIGVYEAFIFLEPGRGYHLLFPERQDKTMAEKLNPYFEPVLYHLGVENSSDSELNYLLAWFNEMYQQMINNNIQLIYSKSRKLDVDGEIARLDSIFGKYPNPFFQDYIRYKYAAFRHLSYHEKSKSISNTYYLNQQVLYNNPAYWDLFNQIYDDYLGYFLRTPKGKSLYTIINEKKCYSCLRDTLGSEKVMSNDTLKELVLLKSLYNEFYDDQFSRASMLVILDSLRQTTMVDKHKTFASDIYQKVVKLLVGYEPPGFELYDKDSVLISLEDLKGNYVYLNFCTSISYSCIQEFEMLRKLRERHNDRFKIVTICMDESLPQMKNFVEKQGYDWTFLHYGRQSDIMKDYDIRAFPTYYFIGPDGKLLLSPAPSPSENVEQKIYEILKRDGVL